MMKWAGHIASTERWKTHTKFYYPRIGCKSWRKPRKTVWYYLGSYSRLERKH